MGGVVGSIAGGLIGAVGSKKAASKEARGYDRAQDMLRPFSSFGEGQINALSRALQSQRLNTPFRFQPTDLQNLPGYQFTRREGLRSVQNAASARGLGLSGAQMRDAMRYSTGLANQTYGDEFNRQMQTWGANMGQAQQNVNNLMGAVGLGQNAAANMGQAAIGAGQARGAGTVGMANAATGAIGDLTAWNRYNSMFGGF